LENVDRTTNSNSNEVAIDHDADHLLSGLSSGLRAKVEIEQKTDFRAAREALNKATKSRQELQLKRQHGVKKVANQAESYAARVNSFLDNYRGLTEIAKGADNMHGGLAIGVVIVALAVSARRRLAMVELTVHLAGACEEESPGSKV
jgi:hypothetical protein